METSVHLGMRLALAQSAGLTLATCVRVLPLRNSLPVTK